MSQARVIVYAHGVVHTSVCAAKDVPVDQVVTEANRQTGPTGLDHGWELSKSETFASGEPNPCSCNSDPDRLHYLLEC